MKNIRVGVVGIGNMGTAHANCIFFGEIEGLMLTALCEINPQKTEYYKTVFLGVHFFSDYKEMIKSGEIDAIIIATPHYLHPVIAEYAFNHGLHVLTEKPAGVSVSNVKKMNEAAAESGKIFAIMFNQRTNYLFGELKKLVQGGKLGQIKRVSWSVTNWYRTQYYYDSGSWRATWAGEGGGVLLNQAPHNLDMLQWIFGLPRKIFADVTVGKYHNIEVEDEANIFMKYDNGMFVTFLTSTGETPGTNRLEVSGTLGKAVAENGELKYWLGNIDEREFCFTTDKLSSHTDYTLHIIKDKPQSTAHKTILRNFAKAILNGEPLIAPGTDGINELLISNAAYLSSWKEEWIDLKDFPYDEFEKRLNELKANSKVKPEEEYRASSGKYKNRWKVNW